MQKAARLLLTLFFISLFAQILTADPKKPQTDAVQDLDKIWNKLKDDEQGRIWGITFIAVTSFLIAIIIFNSNLELSKNNAQIARYEEEIAHVDKMTTEIMVCSLQDQKMGIKYFENPILRKTKDSQLKRTERNLEKKKKNMASLDRDIDDLTARNKKFKDQMMTFRKSMGHGLQAGLLGNLGISGGNPPNVEVEVPLVGVGGDVEVEIEVDAPEVEVEVDLGAEVEVEVDLGAGLEVEADDGINPVVQVQMELDADGNPIGQVEFEIEGEGGQDADLL